MEQKNRTTSDKETTSDKKTKEMVG